MYSIVCAKLTLFYFFLQVKNKPCEPTQKYACIPENSAVTNSINRMDKPSLTN
jgi:hypothetical protein